MIRAVRRVVSVTMAVATAGALAGAMAGTAQAQPVAPQPPAATAGRLAAAGDAQVSPWYPPGVTGRPDRPRRRAGQIQSVCRDQLSRVCSTSSARGGPVSSGVSVTV